MTVLSKLFEEQELFDQWLFHCLPYLCFDWFPDKIPSTKSPRPKSPRKTNKKTIQLASFFCSYVVEDYVVGLRTLVSTGSRSTVFKGIFWGEFFPGGFLSGGFYPVTLPTHPPGRFSFNHLHIFLDQCRGAPFCMKMS